MVNVHEGVVLLKIEWNSKYTTIATYVVITALAIVVLISVINSGVIMYCLSVLNKVLTPVYWGLILAYLFNPILKMCEKYIFRFPTGSSRKRNLKRALSLLLTYIIVLIIITIVALMIVPQLYASFIDLSTKMNGYISATVKWLDEFTSQYELLFENEEYDEIIKAISGFFNIENLDSYLQDLITKSSAIIKDYGPKVVGYFSGLANGFFNVIIGIFFSVYFLASKEKLLAQLKKLLRSIFTEKFYNSVVELANFTDKTFGGFITGKILDSIIVGILCFIICAICKMPYALLVSCFVGITNIIPVVGPFIGAIPGVFIIFIVDPMKALWFIVINVVVQQLDGNVIGPKILGETTGLSAVWVLFSITVMGGIWGLAGMLLAVPIFAIIYSLIKITAEKRLAKRGLPVATSDYYTGIEDRSLDSDGDKHFFASSMRKLASNIADNQIMSKLLKKKKDGSKKSTETDNNESDKK